MGQIIPGPLKGSFHHIRMGLPTVELKRLYMYLSYGVAVIQWITPCHKNRTTTREIIHLRVHVLSSTTSVSTMRFHIEIIFILKAINSVLTGHMINRILHS